MSNINILSSVSTFSLADFQNFIVPYGNVSLLSPITKTVNIGGSFSTTVVPVQGTFTYNSGTNSYDLFNFIVYDFNSGRPSLAKTHFTKTNPTCLSKYFAPVTTTLPSVIGTSNNIYLTNAQFQIVDSSTNTVISTYPPTTFATGYLGGYSGFTGSGAVDTFVGDNQMVIPSNGVGTFDSVTTYNESSLSGQLLMKARLILQGMPAPVNPSYRLVFKGDIAFQNFVSNNALTFTWNDGISVNKPITISAQSGISNLSSLVTVSKSGSGVIYSATYTGSSFNIVFTSASGGTFTYTIVTTFTYGGQTCSTTSTFSETYTC